MVTPSLAERICQAVHPAEWFVGPALDNSGIRSRRPNARTEACFECSHAAGAAAEWLRAHRQALVAPVTTDEAAICRTLTQLAKEALS